MHAFAEIDYGLHHNNFRTVCLDILPLVSIQVQAKCTSIQRNATGVFRMGSIRSGFDLDGYLHSTSGNL